MIDVKSENLDKVILVGLDDNVVGEMDKYQAHEHPAKLHRAASVWLMNRKGQVLLQKRSSSKIVGAGWWGNAVCGNVRLGESYEDCARRRLKEEIGVGNGIKDSSFTAEAAQKITIEPTKLTKPPKTTEAQTPNKPVLELDPIYKFIYKAYCNEEYGEHEVDQVFVGKYDGDEAFNKGVVLNKYEVSEVAWVNFDILVEQVVKQVEVSSSSSSLTPEKTLTMNLEELKKKTSPLEIKVNGKTQFLAPWTWMMLRDSRLPQIINAI